jgi:predicted phage terminase large subunit-like protein
MWTPIFVSAQRLGGEDLPGYILKNYPGKVRHLKFAGGEIAPGGEKEGRIVSNFPETFTAETLEKMRSVNKYVFHAQIQQEPIVMGGNMIRIEEFRYFTEDVESLKFDWLGLYCDTAWKTKQHNDFSVVGTAGRLAGRCYLLDVRRGKWESPEMVEVIRAVFLEWQARAHRMKTWVRKLLIEDHASGTFAIQKLRSEGLPITAVQRVKDKAQRVEDVLPFIAAGSVLLPQNAAWQNDFLDECASFRKDGKHAHDDMVDMLADAVKDTLGRPLSIFDVMGKRRIR